VLAAVRIVDQTATTTLEVALANPGARDAEAVLLVPVPDDAVVSAFAFAGAASEPTAKVLARDEARRLYDGIVAKLRDPALLEFAGVNLVRSSVFPVPAGGTQCVRLTYEHLLSGDGGRLDYVLPRSESLAARVPWQIEVDLRASSPIASAYSPSHELITERREESHWHLATTARCAADPGPFRLSFLATRAGLAASLFAYPDPKVGGGYFLLMAGLPVARDERAAAREVTLVLDRSGSMAGAKMEQAKAAARQVIAALSPADAFNLIDYATAVSSFASAPVAKTRETERAALAYLEAVRPGGGTNLHDALLEALRQPHAGERLPDRAVPHRWPADGRRDQRARDPLAGAARQWRAAPHLHLRRGRGRERAAARSHRRPHARQGHVRAARRRRGGAGGAGVRAARRPASRQFGGDLHRSAEPRPHARGDPEPAAGSV
jgi:Ca-activated chloride channel family protein